MIRRLAARLAGEHGQSLAEFAIVANLAVLLIIAIFEGGVAWYQKMALEHATREAARVAITSATLGPAGMTDAARAKVLEQASGLDSSVLQQSGNIAVASSIPTDRATTCAKAWQPDCDVTVEVKSYPWSIGILGVGFSGSFDIKTSMRIEG